MTHRIKIGRNVALDALDAKSMIEKSFDYNEMSVRESKIISRKFVKNRPITDQIKGVR